MAELRYKPWGENRYTSGSTPTTFHYTGQREDAGLGGLYFYIVFVRNNRPIMVADSILESDIILQNSTWDDEKNLTVEFDGEATAPVFSYDGEWVAFDVFGADNHFNIYVVSIDHGTVLQVTKGNDNKVSPFWRLFFEDN